MLQAFLLLDPRAEVPLTVNLEKENQENIILADQSQKQRLLLFTAALKVILSPYDVAKPLKVRLKKLEVAVDQVLELVYEDQNLAKLDAK